jgi:hypothetical protein
MDPRIKSGGDELGELKRFHMIGNCSRFSNVLRCVVDVVAGVSPTPSFASHVEHEEQDTDSEDDQ